MSQLLLIEHHVTSDRRLCWDCVNKHFILIRALAREGISLDGSNEEKSKLRLMENYAQFNIEFDFSKFSDDERFALIQRVRLKRKELYAILK